MRKFVLLAAAVSAATAAALFVGTSSANADGSTVFNLGPGQYSIGFTHPTGTISVSGGTISARCSASSLKGSAAFNTPQCVTRPIKCPVTATSCAVVANIRESALRGPVQVAGGLLFIGGSYTASAVVQPYNCPQAYSCGTRVPFACITPRTTFHLS